MKEWATTKEIHKLLCNDRQGRQYELRSIQRLLQDWRRCNPPMLLPETHFRAVITERADALTFEYDLARILRLIHHYRFANSTCMQLHATDSYARLVATIANNSQ